MEFKELSVEELSKGYTKIKNEKGCTCIFCGEIFEDGIVYTSRDRMVNAERAVREHIWDIHGGVFHGLITLDKQINGISETQKDILNGMYQEKENKVLGEEMGISSGTVRTHKFNLQKQKREAKILLALLEQVENEELMEERKSLCEAEALPGEQRQKSVRTGKKFTGNTLHPFFTQYNLK